MIDTYMREYLHIVEFLLQKDGAILRKGFLCVPKETLLKLLEHNQYESAYHKLTIWRDLQWIDTEPDRFTRRITIGGQAMTAVKIRMVVYETLGQLLASH